MEPVRVYLDTCVWLRPYDDQSQERIRRETDALRWLLRVAAGGDVEIAGSELVREEAERLPLPGEEVHGLLSAVSIWTGPSPVTAVVAGVLVSALRLSTPDAVHIALSAEVGEWFLTCDDKLLKRSKMIERTTGEKGYRLRVRSPVEFQRQWQKREK